MTNLGNSKRALAMPAGAQRHLCRAAGALTATVAMLVCVSASALSAGPVWRVTAFSNTTVPAGGTFDILAQVANVGDAPTDGTPFTLRVTLPPGLRGVGVVGNLNCPSVAGATVIVCEGDGQMNAPSTQALTFTVAVEPDATGVLTSRFELSGADAPNTAATADPVTVASAPPGFGIDAFDGQVTANAEGDPLTQAGGHPYMAVTTIDFNTDLAPPGLAGVPIAATWPIEPVKTVLVDLPPGFVGNPTAATRCTGPELANMGEGAVDVRSLCPPTSQVGTALVRASGGTFGPVPVYNLVPPDDRPARFGFNILGTVVVLDAELRSGGDYGLTVGARNTSEGLALAGTTIEFWGVPAEETHDAQRACGGQAQPWVGGPTCRSGIGRQAFLRNPTSCTPPGVGLPTTVRVDSWQHPGLFRQATFLSHLPLAYPFASIDWGPQVGTDGCARVPFEPVLAGHPVAESKAGTPTAFTFDVSLPQSSDPDSIGQGDLKKAVVTLPRGVRVSPSSADGLQACSSAQIALGDTSDPTCPDASKIGSLTITTPLLEDPLTGGIYLARPFDNPFDSLIAIYLVARGPGLVVKLPGRASLDQDTGQITTTFDDNPQLPFSNLHLEFNGGPRAPLVLPTKCGTYTTHSVLTSWSGTTVTSDSSFTLTENAKGRACPSEFTPGFSAGTDSFSAGASSPFRLRLTRDDVDQDLGSLSVTMPEGLLGRIASVDLCAETEARLGMCSDGSKVGSVTVGAGAGTNPFYIASGRAYITGPYRGAPFGMSIVVPAVAGPFDLGTVVVRAAIFVDKHDATLSVVSDPLPTILQGIPLDVRDVRVSVDRDEFIVNPTSCAEKRIGGTILSTEGATAAVSSRYQAADCASLPLKPKMTLVVGGRGHTGRRASTPLTATLKQTPGQANLRFVRVTLPTTINARLTVINDACTRPQYEAGNCARARTGTAVARTPLLRAPLKGDVYFVKNGNPLPDLFVALRGQVDFDLIGKITIPGSKRLRTTFESVPDVPISSFSLRLVSGRDGSIGTAANLCSARSRTARAELDFRGQNGKVLQVQQHLKVKGCGKVKAKRGSHRRGR